MAHVSESRLIYQIADNSNKETVRSFLKKLYDDIKHSFDEFEFKVLVVDNHSK